MSRRRYFEEQRSGNGAIYHCVEIDTDHDNRFEVLNLNGIIYRFQINNKKYVFMFSNNYDGKSDLIQNADEDVDCIFIIMILSLHLFDYVC